MDMGGSLLAVDEGNNMWVMKAFQDVDFRVQVLLQLLVKFIQVDGLDSNIARLLLS